MLPTLDTKGVQSQFTLESTAHLRPRICPLSRMSSHCQRRQRPRLGTATDMRAFSDEFPLSATSKTPAQNRRGSPAFPYGFAVSCRVRLHAHRCRGNTRTLVWVPVLARPIRQSPPFAAEIRALPYGFAVSCRVRLHAHRCRGNTRTLVWVPVLARPIRQSPLSPRKSRFPPRVSLLVNVTNSMWIRHDFPIVSYWSVSVGFSNDEHSDRIHGCLRSTGSRLGQSRIRSSVWGAGRALRHLSSRHDC